MSECSDWFRTNNDQPHVSERSLWCAVLLAAISDAMNGAPNAISSSVEIRILETKRARRYLTEPHYHGFINVCEMAGLDPIAVRERLRILIAQAPTPEELVSGAKPGLIDLGRTLVKDQRKPRRNSATKTNNCKTGGGSDFAHAQGTGGGTVAQDRPEIDFSEKAA